ncbi:MAG: hypothetical protein NTZ33_13955 [Bacteroidetes bacterium]|nr:hypothetical protein [Bacteroidota bacterium]
MGYKGNSYNKRLKGIIDIYDKWAAIGLTNAEIYRRHIYPVYEISDRTFYNYLKNSGRIDELPEIPNPDQLALFEE